MVQKRRRPSTKSSAREILNDRDENELRKSGRAETMEEDRHDGFASLGWETSRQQRVMTSDCRGGEGHQLRPPKVETLHPLPLIVGAS